MKIRIIAGAFALIIGSPALAQNPDAITDQEYMDQEAEFYNNCIAGTEQDPASALDTALTWRDTGGGLPARHCAGVAYTALGQYMNAAIEFETLGDEMRRGLGWSFLGVAHPGSRGLLAQVYAQGGNAWLLAGDATKAFELFTLGLAEEKEKTEVRANLLIDRALAMGQLGEYQTALDDILEVEEFIQATAQLHILKASAYRGLEKFPEAGVEIEKAFRLDPDYGEAFFERGNLLRQIGDNDGARENWLAYLRKYPNGAAADVIRQNLEAMDVKQ